MNCSAVLRRRNRLLVIRGTVERGTAELETAERDFFFNKKKTTTTSKQ